MNEFHFAEIIPRNPGVYSGVLGKYPLRSSFSFCRDVLKMYSIESHSPELYFETANGKNFNPAFVTTFGENDVVQVRSSNPDEMNASWYASHAWLSLKDRLEWLERVSPGSSVVIKNSRCAISSDGNIRCSIHIEVENANHETFFENTCDWVSRKQEFSFPEACLQSVDKTLDVFGINIEEIREGEWLDFALSVERVKALMKQENINEQNTLLLFSEMLKFAGRNGAKSIDINDEELELSLHEKLRIFSHKRGITSVPDSNLANIAIYDAITDILSNHYLFRTPRIDRRKNYEYASEDKEYEKEKDF